MIVEIDNSSGFCFGVTTAISKAQEELAKGGTLYCLGDIVHNSRECERLKALGLVTIDHRDFEQLHHAKVLLRAHGEPPETYRIARENDIEIIDATCPVVLKLQQRIRLKEAQSLGRPHQIVIYGQQNHAEVLGLVGQTSAGAILIDNKEDIDKLDYSKDIYLFSQTTKSHDQYKEIVAAIGERVKPGVSFYFSDSVCGQVSSRVNEIRTFAAAHDLIFFVSGKKSSNGKVLFEECCRVNPRSYLIDSASEIDFSLLNGVSSVGICGATSTPKWLMEECREAIVKRGE